MIEPMISLIFSVSMVFFQKQPFLIYPERLPEIGLGWYRLFFDARERRYFQTFDIQPHLNRILHGTANSVNSLRRRS